MRKFVFLYIFTSENQHIQKNEIQIVAVNKPKIDDLAYLICREGWPHACGQEAKEALSQAFDYVDAVIKKDVSRVDGVNRNSTTPDYCCVPMREIRVHKPQSALSLPT